MQILNQRNFASRIYLDSFSSLFSPPWLLELLSQPLLLAETQTLFHPLISLRNAVAKKIIRIEVGQSFNLVRPRVRKRQRQLHSLQELQSEKPAHEKICSVLSSTSSSFLSIALQFAHHFDTTFVGARTSWRTLGGCDRKNRWLLLCVINYLAHGPKVVHLPQAILSLLRFRVPFPNKNFSTSEQPIHEHQIIELNNYFSNQIAEVLKSWSLKKFVSSSFTSCKTLY